MNDFEDLLVFLVLCAALMIFSIVSGTDFHLPDQDQMRSVIQREGP